MIKKVLLTPEQERWIVENFPTTSNAECARHLGISKHQLYCVKVELGLAKTEEYMAAMQARVVRIAHRANALLGAERWQKISAGRRETNRKERLRIKWGLEQRTKQKFGHNRRRALCRYSLKKCGYEVEKGGITATVTEATVRNLIVERRAQKYGIKIIENDNC